MSSSTYTFSYGSTPSSGIWDQASNWGNASNIPMILDSDGGTPSDDSLVLPAGNYTTYLDTSGDDNFYNLTVNTGVTVELDPNANDFSIEFGGTIYIAQGATLNTDSPGTSNSTGVPMEIGFGSNTGTLTPEPNAGTMFIEGKLVGSGYIDPNITVMIGNGGVIVSTPDPNGDTTGLTINASLEGTITVETQDGATLTLGGSIASTVTVDTGSSNGAFEIDQADQFSGSISGLSIASVPGDDALVAAGTIPADVTSYLDLVGVSNGLGPGQFNGIEAIDSASYTPTAGDPTAGGVLTVVLTPYASGDAGATGPEQTETYNISGNYVHGPSNTPDKIDVGSDNGNNSTQSTGTPVDGYNVVFSDLPCFLPGTRILTPSGNVAVETLSEGDLVIAVVDGRHVAQPVKWIGHRKLTLDQRAVDSGLAPIRIRRGAMAENLPVQDLLVSGPHAMFIDGKLVPAKLLVNDMTIVREQGMTSVEYYHVELARHAILVAEGLETESYLDTGNRAFFGNAGLALILHPEFHINAGLACWETDACAPLAVSPAEVLPIWRPLADRAVALGYVAPNHVTTTDTDLHLQADGRRLDSIAVHANTHSFMVPAGVKSLALGSRSAIPNQITPYLDDPRRLGVAVSRILFRGQSGRVEFPADHPALARGWYPADRTDRSIHRWTNGHAILPATGLKTPVIVDITLAATTQYLVNEAPLSAALAAA